MVDWRERIIEEFQPGLSKLTIASDPDGLLFETGVYRRLRGMGFKPVPLEDPGDFDRIRPLFDTGIDEGGETMWLVVVKRAPEDRPPRPDQWPETAPTLSFSLAGLFPGLDGPALRGIDAGEVDALHRAVTEFDPTNLTTATTRDFVLRHVYEIAPELVRQPRDLLGLLLRLFFRPRLPAGEYLVHLVSYWRSRSLFADWPLEDIVPDPAAFLTFLQERWPLFLDRFAQDMAMISDWGAPYGFEYPGPMELPFGHDEVKPYISRLFAEGWLEPVEHHEVQRLAGTWAAVGLVYDPASDNLRRLHLLLTDMVQNRPSVDENEAVWRRLARQWAQCRVLNEQEWYVETPESRFGLEKVREMMDRSYGPWVAGHYHALAGRYSRRPVMLHHLPTHLAQVMDREHVDRLALIVVGGLTISQWLVMKPVLKYQAPDFRFREQSLFAGLPTLTGLNRSAIFSGREPDGPMEADRDAAAWSRFWTRKGVDPERIGFADGVDGKSLPEVDHWMMRRDVKIVGLTINTLNRTDSKRPAGPTSLLDPARQWAQTGYLTALVDRLLVRGFRVWLASDHGRIETVGLGRVETDGPAEPGGDRVALFGSLQKRSRAAQKFPEANQGPWPVRPGQIPPLYAPGRSSFLKKGTKGPAHGGYSLEETIVPLVEVYARAR